MIVHHILQSKANKGIFTISAERPITVAAQTLHENRIGALVVTGEAGSIIGILSERDIVRGMALQGQSCAMWKVSDLMTAHVLVCDPQDTLDDLMSVMSKHHIRHLPVVENGKLVGMVTIRDVVKAKLEEASQEVDHLRDYVMTGG